MQPWNEALRRELLAMAEHDRAVREELIADGSLAGHAYHPRMEAVHRRNAARLGHIIERHGWPGASLVGEDGAGAAWLIAQHAVGNPPLMRQSLTLLREAAAAQEAPGWQAAMMEDRIRMYEGRPQIYGTQFRPDAKGALVPYAIDDPSNVNERRRAVGLSTLEQRIAEMQRQSAGEKRPSAPDLDTEYEKWLRSTGWRD